MVFENVFAGVANQLLGSYIENIDSKDMSLGLGGTDKFNIVTSNVWHFEVKTMVKFSFRFDDGSRVCESCATATNSRSRIAKHGP